MRSINHDSCTAGGGGHATDNNISPCVRYSLKCHKIYNSSRVWMVKPLMGVQRLWVNKRKGRMDNTPAGKHLTEYVKKSILEEPIVIPANLRSQGVTIRDIATLEKHNGFPIVVYYLDHTVSPAERKRIRQQMKSVSKNGGNIDDIRHYTSDIGLTCVRAPTKKFLDIHKAPICHLLLIGPKHVCYIPSIQDSMTTAFRDRANYM